MDWQTFQILSNEESVCKHKIKDTPSSGRGGTRGISAKAKQQTPILRMF
jgi:hypothetical protein